jgi:hypothetical protein
MPASTGSPSLHLQTRDIQLLRGLYESRVMTHKHAAAIYFQCRTQAVKKRLQKLKTARLIRERPRHPYQPAVLELKPAGYRLLRDGEHLDGYPRLSEKAVARRARVSDLTIRHELQVMDVKAAFALAAAGHPRLSLPAFSTWPRLHEFRAAQPSHPGAGPAQPPVRIKPDGFLQIHEHADGDTDGVFEHLLFLELDRSTEPRDTLARRASCYLGFYRSGGMAKRFGASADDFKAYPFRVCSVLKSQARRDGIAQRLLENKPPTLHQVCLTTLDHLQSDPLGPIWVQPADYRETEAPEPHSLIEPDGE